MKVICFIHFAIMMILAMFDNVVRAQRHTKQAGQPCSSNSDCAPGLTCNTLNRCMKRPECLIM